jgi:hypothetical protein
MRVDFEQGSVFLADIPALNDTAIRSRGKLHPVTGRPPDIPDSLAVRIEAVFAPKGHDASVAREHAQIPHSDSSILAA